jgi:hypothetical protein
VGILGCCGGTKDDVDRVWFFEAAGYFLQDNKTIQVIHPVPRQMKPEALWRDHENDEPNLLKRDKHKVPTVFTALEVVEGESLLKTLQTNDVVIHGAKKDDLEFYGVEMEVAAIWKVVEKWNRDNPISPITVLPAVKGVSDSGSNAERDEHLIPVIKTSTKFLIEYLTKQFQYLN